MHGYSSLNIQVDQLVIHCYYLHVSTNPTMHREQFGVLHLDHPCEGIYIL